jgi:UDPglucose 6-dehydrogenase
MMGMIRTITVLGAGYVGLTTAALLAHCGYKVYAIEPNKKRLDVIKTGKSFFYEEGLDSVIKTAIDSGNLMATDSYEDSVPNSEVVFSCVGTPDNADGSSNLSYVFGSAEQAAGLMMDGTIFVQKSTVPVGTGTKIIELFTSLNKAFPYVSNPEFLREGTALYDTLYFDRVVAGGADDTAVETILGVYKILEEHRDTIAEIAHVTPHARKGKYIGTNLNSAELIKVTANAFLALKISFANSIAKLADKVDADVVEVMDAVGADERIGRAFLNAGRGYGGGCFPKDVSGLLASGLESGVNLEIMEAAQAVNLSMPGYIVEKLKNELKSLEGKKVAVLGLSFKAGTSDARKSPGVAIANSLEKNGATVSAYDPKANEEATEFLNDNVQIKDSTSDAIESADAVIVATEWDEFKQLSIKTLSEQLSGNHLVDAVNIYNKQSVTREGLIYIGVGR